MSTYSTQQKVIIISGVLSTLFICFLLLIDTDIGNSIEAILYDYRFVIRNKIQSSLVPEKILIVEIDERSLERYGRWPWSRKLQAGLIEKILRGSPQVLVIDIVYIEPESQETDVTLGKILKHSRAKIVLATGFDIVKDGDKVYPDFILESTIKRIKDYTLTQGTVEVNKIKIGPEIIYRDNLLGHVYSPPEKDGKIRREYLYIKYMDELFPSLSLVASALALGMKVEDITVLGGKGITLRNFFIPTDHPGRMKINYLGKEKTFRHISAVDVLDEKFDTSIFVDKIVLIGTTAISTYDFAVTPLSARLPGVEKNATVIENIINKRFIKDLSLLSTVLAVIISGAILLFLLSRLRARSGMVASFIVIILFIFINLYLFFTNIYMNMFYPFLNLLLISITGFSYKYIKEERRARELKKLFTSYVSPKIVEQLLHDPYSTKLGGIRREITILFSDIRGFTSLSEKMAPEEVVILLNEYFKEMTDIIFKWDGTLDKFVGDEIMAFWNAPLEQPDHAELALRAALDMSDRLDELQKKWKSEGKPVLDCGIGINTGIVLIGNIGAQNKKMDYTAIGDHVNLGARVEKLTRECNTRILITEFTYEKIAPCIQNTLFGHIEITEFGTVQIRGREKPVRIYSVRSLPHHS